jgi:hypothetical protein
LIASQNNLFLRRNFPKTAPKAKSDYRKTNIFSYGSIYGTYRFLSITSPNGLIGS